MTSRYVFGILVAVVLGITAGGYWYLDTTSHADEYERLIMRAQSFATLLETGDIEQLAGTESDLSNPAYARLKQHLTSLRATNTDLTFVYLMGVRDGRIVFLADSEQPDSEDYSPPGQIYDEATAELLQGFAPGTPYVLEISEDRWGEWISALAPIHDAQGATLALIGIDKNAREHREQFYIQVGLLGVGAFLILLLVALLHLLRTRESEFATEKTTFLAAAAHELRSPLTSIRWALSKLRNDESLSPSARTTADELYDRVRGLIDLTNTFLLSASTDHGIVRPEDMKVIDSAPVIAEAVRHSMALAMTKKIRIDVTFPLNERFVLRGDPDRLRLVFENLLSNAVKYSPEGSTITLSHEDRGAMRVFTVRDQGIGIPKEDREKIFSGYHRAKNAKSSGVLGSGFGLYMVKKIIDLHGGTIEALPAPERGTLFVVSLPAGAQ